MIRVAGLYKTFGARTALAGVSLDVNDGELFGLVGPDGAGKTTILRLLAGLSLPDSGEARIIAEGGDCHLGYMPQRFSLYEEFTVMENLQFFGAIWGLSKENLRSRAETLLDRTGLLPFANRPAGKLSGGMKQKLGLAAALLHKPGTVLLDEPGTGVDPVSRREFWRLLYELHGEGLTILLTTPYMDEAELCGRVGFLHDGRLIAVGSPAELKKNYPYSVLILSCPQERLHTIIPSLRGTGVFSVTPFGDTLHIATSDPGRTTKEASRLLQREKIVDFSMEEASPSLEDLFVYLTGRDVA
ncbi:MAG: ABC transporter ATP-binding protein [Thermovirgaceae bacterium]|nr:ABC transporter ATP-binding protein [Thermovirgaceae bacterium]